MLIAGMRRSQHIFLTLCCCLFQLTAIISGNGYQFFTRFVSHSLSHPIFCYSVRPFQQIVQTWHITYYEFSLRHVLLFT